MRVAAAFALAIATALLWGQGCSSSSNGNGNGNGNGSGDVGDPCTSGDQCQSGVCIPNGVGAEDGSCRGACPGAIGQAVCAADTDEGCLPGWSRWSVSGRPPYYCMCTGGLSSEDVCNGWDDNCDGFVDEDGDAFCEAQASDLGCDGGACRICPVRCDGACVNTAIDLDHCGGCGLACPEPTAAADPVCSPDGCKSAEIISPTTGRLHTPIVDDTSIYYLERRRMYKCPLAGCTGEPEVVTEETGYANTVVLHDGELYWSAESRLYKCPVGGCDDPTVLGDQASYHNGFVIVDSTIYVAASFGDTRQISRCSTTTGCPETPDVVVSGLVSLPRIVVTDGDYLYFGRDHDFAVGESHNGAFLRCPLAGCAVPEEVIGNVAPRDLFAVSNGQLYFLWGHPDPDTPGIWRDRIYRCPTAGCAGSPEVVADEVPSGRFLAIEDSTLYWITSVAIESCPISGCDRPIPEATGLSKLSGLALAPGGFYLTSDGNQTPADGKLRRIAR